MQPPHDPVSARVAFTAQVDDLNIRARALETDDLDSAYSLAESAAHLAESGDYAEGLAAALLTQASIDERRGDYARSMTTADRTLALCEALGRHGDAARSLYLLAWNTYGLGDYPRAMAYALRHLRLAEEIGDETAQAEAHNSLGAIHSAIGSLTEAEDDHYPQSVAHYQRSLALYTALGQPARQAVLLNNLCVTHQYMERYSEALDYGLKALERSRAAEDRYSEVLVLGNLGIVYRYLGQLEQARDYYARRLTMTREAGYRPLEAHTLLSLGRLDVLTGALDSARTYVQAALAIAEETGYRKWAYECHEQLALIAEKAGDFAGALAHYKQFHTGETALINENSRAAVDKLKLAYNLDKIGADLAHERAQRAREQAAHERLSRLKDDLIRAASHDLKNPLASLFINLELSARALPIDTERAASTLARALRDATRMRDMIHLLLDKARLEIGGPLDLQPVALDAFIATALDDHRTLAVAKQVRLSAAIPPLRARLDPAQMRQVIDNLLSNAIKYTPTGGQVTLNAMARPDNALVLTLRDTGIGIPAHALPHLFRPFYRVDSPRHLAEEGTGLGLSIVETIIVQHGGQIAVESVEDVGTAFILTLPGALLTAES